MIRLLFVVFLLLFGQLFFIVSHEEIDFDTERQELKMLYLNWFGSVYDSAAKLTGEVIKVEWFSYNLSQKPGNS